MTISNAVEELNKFITSSSSKDGGHIFAIKITNYDLLSIILTSEALKQLMLDALECVTTTLASSQLEAEPPLCASHYVFFITSPLNNEDLSKLPYRIYHDLHLSKKVDKHSIECKISSTPLSSSLTPESLAQNLLCTLEKYKGDNYYVEFHSFAVKEQQDTNRKLQLLVDAIKNKTCSFAYQPIIERKTGHIPYYECLLRIPNKNSELVSVGPYIELAEKAGLHNIIDQMVLKMVVSELKAAPNITLAVNISNAGILDPVLLELAQKLLRDESIAKRLVIEITETSINLDFKRARDFTRIIREFGCQIAIDDFGAGFTSFKQLKDLFIDIIKIDGGFIRDLVGNEHDQHIVLALIEMSEQLSIKTVAEFVENGEIAKFLLNAKIDYMQGNFFSPALNYRSWNQD